MKTMINQSIYGDLNVKGGVVMLIGVIKSETEKAVRIEYGLEPVFVGKFGSSRTTVNRASWVPKSQIKVGEYGMLEISRWFSNKMQSQKIDSYEI